MYIQFAHSSCASSACMQESFGGDFLFQLSRHFCCVQVRLLRLATQQFDLFEGTLSEVPRYIHVHKQLNIHVRMVSAQQC